MTIRQKDIADRLGVSVSLVSRVLSGRASEIGVPEATATRILEAAASMGYVPVAAARALQGKSTRTLGVMVSDFGDPFFGPIIQELHRLAHAHDFSLVLFASGDDRERELDRRALLKHGFDGLLVLGGGIALSRLKMFQDRRIPMVHLGSGAESPGLSAVLPDEEKAFRDLLEAMVRAGARTFGYLGVTGRVHDHRREVLFRLLREMNLPLIPSWCLRGDSAADEDSGYSLTFHAVGRNTECCDCLVASNDRLAAGAVRASLICGLRMPLDWRITGFDDVPAARHLTPALTTLRQPVREMTKAAFDMLQADMKLPPAKRQTSWKHFPCELVVRESA